MTDALARDTLKEICRACGLDDTGRGEAAARRADLGRRGRCNRLISTKTPDSGSAGDGSVGLGTYPAPTSPKETKENPRRAKGPSVGEQAYQSDAVVSGSLKAALRQFALAAAGGYRGHGAAVNFATTCSSASAGRTVARGATIPRAAHRRSAASRRSRWRCGGASAAPCWRWCPTTQCSTSHGRTSFTRACKSIRRRSMWCSPISAIYSSMTWPGPRRRPSIHIEDLPKYSEAFPFFTTAWQPGQTPRIVNVEKVSAEVADLVAKLYHRSVRAQHPTRERDVIRFTLQCITAMFAEDIGLLWNFHIAALRRCPAQEPGCAAA